MNGEFERTVEKVELSDNFNTYWKDEIDYDNDELSLGLELLGTEKLLREGLRGQGVKVAVVDTGVDEKVSKFGDKIKGQKWFRYSGDATHGTHAAGIIHRVAPDAEIYDYCCFGSSGEYTVEESMASSILQAYLDGCRIISVSIGTPSADIDVLRAITYVHGRGAIVVAASGNPGGNDSVLTNEWCFPAVLEECLNIAALCKSRNTFQANFNRNKKDPKVNYVGVGSSISSYNKGGSKDGNYVTLSGTSLTCPQVAGLLAALLSDGSQYRKMMDRKLADIPLGKKSALKWFEENVFDSISIDTGIKGYDNQTSLKFLTYLNPQEFQAALNENNLDLNQ